MDLRGPINHFLGYVVLFPVVVVALASECYADDWKQWRPVDPEHLALKAPQVEKDADAEVLIWEVRLADDTADLVFSHYVRIKVFTERGKESQSTIDIIYLGRNKIADIAGRTIKPDGSILELKREAVYDRTIVKASGLKVNAKSFAMPGVEAGAIIEYRWREIRYGQWANYVRLHFQREIPVQHVKYYIKPYSRSPYGMRGVTFNTEFAGFVKAKDGFYTTEMRNMPAFREEPRMPPEDQVRAWMLLYYAADRKLDPDKFWKDLGKRLHDTFKSEVKVNDEVRRAAASATGDAVDSEEKLQRILHFCRTSIKNVSDDASGLTDADREKLKDNKNASDTLKRGMGTANDVDMLFAAMATAAGFDVRLAVVADRSDIFFDPGFPDSYFLSAIVVGVRMGNEWRFFDAGSPYAPFGMLSWQYEGQEALICDPKEPSFVTTPLSLHDKSVEKRRAVLKLSEDGTLEGDVQVEYTGHLGTRQKEFNDEDSPEQRQQTLRDLVKNRLSTAEVSNVRIENVTDPFKPFTYSYHVRIPGYAQRTGRRLFFQPAFFQKGANPEFATGDRRYQVYFHFPWSEEDNVRIELPPGFELENAETPGSFDAQGISGYRVKVEVHDGGKAIELHRAYYFGGKGSIVFPPNSYLNIKNLFDELHRRDSHTLTVRQSQR